MTSSRSRFGITLAFLGLVYMLPAAAEEQPPGYLTQWGSYGAGNGQFICPSGLATDAAGNVYVTDECSCRIQKFTTTGAYITQWGSLGSGERQFEAPFGVAIDADGNVYIGDYRRIQKFTSTGTYITQWGSHGSGNAQFSTAKGVATDVAGNVYVADMDNSRIQKFTGTGTYLTQWAGDGQLLSPAGVATDAAGNVYVADSENHRIQKFSSTGAYLTQWGSFGTADGQFNNPTGVATDAAGNVYVADYNNQRIQKFGPVPIAMKFDLTPRTLHLASRGRWVTGFLEPASPFAASDIDISSIRLNGTVPVDPAAPTALGDHDGNGVPDLMVKFDRAAVELTVSGGDDVPITVTGTVDGHSFSGTE